MLVAVQLATFFAVVLSHSEVWNCLQAPPLDAQEAAATVLLASVQATCFTMLQIAENLRMTDMLMINVMSI